MATEKCKDVICNISTRKNRITPKKLLRLLGSGLITGASDNDPSGVATYSQTGAQVCYGMLWTMVFVYSHLAPGLETGLLDKNFAIKR